MSSKQFSPTDRATAVRNLMHYIFLPAETKKRQKIQEVSNAMFDMGFRHNGICYWIEGYEKIIPKGKLRIVPEHTLETWETFLSWYNNMSAHKSKIQWALAEIVGNAHGAHDLYKLLPEDLKEHAGINMESLALTPCHGSLSDEDIEKIKEKYKAKYDLINAVFLMRILMV